MSSSRRVHRFVPGLAVASVTLAALGAIWLGPREDGTPAVRLAAARPAPASRAVEVVKTPAATMRPASCRDCAPIPSAPAGLY